METIKKKACLYIRVSTNDQENSVAAQTDRLKAYCTFNNIEIVKILEDSHVSGGMEISNRPAGQKIVELIVGKEINCIVATKIDRLFRSTVDALTTVEIWGRRNIALHLADMSGVSLDTSSANGKFFFTIMASSAEYERNKVADRTKEVLNHKRNNLKVYNHPPLGYDVSGVIKDENDMLVSAGVLVPNAEEQEIVRTIFKMDKDGASMNQIANELNEKKIPTKNKTLFYRSTISKILNNEIYKEIRNTI